MMLFRIPFGRIRKKERRNIVDALLIRKKKRESGKRERESESGDPLKKLKEQRVYIM